MKLFQDLTDCSTALMWKVLRELHAVSMKLEKAAGVDGLLVEDIQYAHPVLLLVVKKLFNFMIECGYVPNKKIKI